MTHDQDEALSLADRIVVMKDGVVQQIAAPEDVYGQPANLHVARVHGLSQCAGTRRSERRGGRSRHAGRARRAADAACASSRSRTAGACVAIRPEELALGARTGGEATPIAGRVDNVEYCGRDSLVDVVTASGTRLHVRATGTPRLGEHSATVHVPVERVLVYPA